MALAVVRGRGRSAACSSAATPGDGPPARAAPGARRGGPAARRARGRRSAVPRPAALDAAPSAGTAVWAPVLRRTLARAAPSTRRPGPSRGSAPRTPEGTANILEVIGRRRDERGALWVRVRLAVLPNGTTGWIPRTAIGGLTAVHTHLVVDLGAAQGDAACATAASCCARRSGSGAPGAATPTGRFYIRNRLSRFASPTYGPVAFGTSARSADLTDWPAGGYIGIHGTDQPELLPGARVARLHPDAQRGHPAPRAAHAGRHARDGAGVMTPA